jgi:recombination protein RecA
LQLDVVQKSGSWFSMNDTRLGQGRDGARQYLKEHPEMMAELEEVIRQNADALQGKGKKAEAPSARGGKPVAIEVDDSED